MPTKDQVEQTETRVITKTVYKCDFCSKDYPSRSNCLRHEYDCHWAKEVIVHEEDLGEFQTFLYFEREEAFRARVAHFEDGTWEGPGWYETVDKGPETNQELKKWSDYDQGKAIWFTGTTTKEQEAVKGFQILFGFSDDAVSFMIEDQLWARYSHFMPKWGISIEYAIPQGKERPTAEQILTAWRMWRGGYGYEYDYDIERTG